MNVKQTAVVVAAIGLGLTACTSAQQAQNQTGQSVAAKGGKKTK